MPAGGHACRCEALGLVEIELDAGELGHWLSRGRRRIGNGQTR
jgi:hypothetical protein